MQVNDKVRALLTNATGTVVAVDNEKQTATVHWAKFITETENVPLGELAPVYELLELRIEGI